MRLGLNVSDNYDEACQYCGEPALDGSLPPVCEFCATQECTVCHDGMAHDTETMMCSTCFDRWLAEQDDPSYSA